MYKSMFKIELPGKQYMGIRMRKA
ncbi:MULTISPECIES: hypothetical protein [unclassified Paenibacillus]